MKESVIRKKALEVLNSEGWICWYPFHIRYKKEVDIFGVFDILAFRKLDGEFLFIQITTLSNIRAREKKVKTFYQKNGIKKFPGEVWGYDKKKKYFKIIKV